MSTSLKRNRNLHSKAVTVASGMTSLIATWNEHNTVSCIQMLTAGQCFKKRVITSSAWTPYMWAKVTMIWCCVTSVNRTERETWSLNYVASLYSFGWNFQRQKKNTLKRVESRVPGDYASSSSILGGTHQQVIEVQQRWTVNWRVHVSWRRLDADHYGLGVHVVQAVQTDKEHKEESGRLITTPCSLVV